LQQVFDFGRRLRKVAEGDRFRRGVVCDRGKAAHEASEDRSYWAAFHPTILLAAVWR
jgi:hypothetical protein